MAILNSEVKTNQANTESRSTYEAIAQNVADLSNTDYMSVGSLVLVLEDNKVYIKESDNKWTEV
jgi:hypothetical protein